mmetsp:Transcript_91141/g.262870  ORF Transcript_91141/g.262870 Transcript_91141/m.262870 type:complete len:252 (+) Transcript_91141:109-864(+)
MAGETRCSRGMERTAWRLPRAMALAWALAGAPCSAVSVEAARQGALRRASAATEGVAGAIVEGAASSGPLTADILRKVSEEQVMLLNRLARLDQAVSATLARSTADMATAVAANKALLNVKEKTAQAKVYAEGASELVKETRTKQNSDSKAGEEAWKELKEASKATDAAIKENAKALEISAVSHQIDDNKLLLKRLGPRITALATRLTSVELVLQKGNISAVVNDASKVAMSDVLRDMNRGMYQLLRSDED